MEIIKEYKQTKTKELYQILYIDTRQDVLFNVTYLFTLLGR